MKQKKYKKNKISTKISFGQFIVIIISICLIIIGLTIIFVKYNEKTEYTYSETEIKPQAYQMKNENEINIEDIIKENIKELTKEEIQVQEIDLEYNTEYVYNKELPQGEMQVIQEGRDGRQKQIITKTYIGEQVEENIQNIIQKASVDKIIQIGSASYTSSHTIKIEEEVYVTPTTLAIRKEPSNNAQKVITISKNETVKIIKIEDEWYQVNYKTYEGWIPSNCVTYISPETENKNSGYSKQQLLARLSSSMNINKPSEFTLEQFKKVLSNDSNDTNKVFEKNAEYFYYIEKQYKINGIVIAAIGIHESGWGTSKISLDKKNLFGYGAYDSNPYQSAYSFKNYSEGIDLIARVLKKYYINPAETIIYDGQIASGSHFHGNTLSAINKDYATDKNWANAVYKWTSYLYNKL